MIKANKNTLVSAILLLAFIAIIARFLPPFVKPVLQLTLSKNSEHITRIDQPRKISDTQTLWVDKLNLHHNHSFAHPKLGPLGWSENFFVDLDSTFTVETPGRYRFVVGSDDGFVLKVNGKELCQFQRDRPYQRQTCFINLNKGEHQLHLSYFQAYSQAGLTLEFAPAGGGKSLKYWGERIKGVRYISAD